MDDVLEYVAAMVTRTYKPHPPLESIDELVQVALLAAIEARPRYDPKRRTTERTYLWKKARWGIADFRRRSDWLGRESRRDLTAYHRMRGQGARVEERLELLAALEHAYHTATGDPDLDAAAPETEALVNLRLELSAAIDALPARQRALIVARYWDDLSLEQCAARVGIQKAYAFQLHRRALLRLGASRRLRQVRGEH